MAQLPPREPLLPAVPDTTLVLQARVLALGAVAVVAAPFESARGPRNLRKVRATIIESFLLMAARSSLLRGPAPDALMLL